MNLGRYEIIAPIGAGATGTVFRARGPDGATVAVKLLRLGDAGTAARLARELSVQRSLGEGFVPVLDSGSAPQGAFIVMPLVEGGTLRDRLARGPFTVASAVQLGVALGRALGRAHRAGVVHRDLKPENVLFQGEQPLIADLGLAKLVASDDTLSKTGDTRGTFGYMPSEQMKDAKHAGPAANVFALGAVVYECLTGRSAFAGATALNVIDLVDSGRFASVRTLRPEIPRAVAAVVERALSLDPAGRPEDGEAFAQALAAAARGTVARPRRARLAVVLATLALAVSLAALARRPETPPPRPSTPAPPAPRVTTLSTIAVLGTSTFRHGARATAIVARPGHDEVFVGDSHGIVRRWSVPAGAEVESYELFRGGEVTAIAALSDGSAVAVGTGEARGLVFLEPAPIKITNVDTADVFALAASPTGTRFAIVAPLKVQVFDRASRSKLIDELASEKLRITAAAFRDEDTLLIGSEDGNVAATTILPIRALPPVGKFAGPIRSIAVSPNGRNLAVVARDGSLHYLADERTGEVAEAVVRALTFAPGGRALFLTEKNDLFALTFAEMRAKPIGRRIPYDPRPGFAAVVHEGTIHEVVAEPVSGNPIVLAQERAPGHERLVSALLALPGRRLASAGVDRTVRLWDLGSGEVAVSRDQRSAVLALALAPDGRSITSISVEGGLVVHNVSTLAPLASVSTPLLLLSATGMPDGTSWGTTAQGVREISLAGPGRLLARGFVPQVIEDVGDGRLAAWDEREVRLYDAPSGVALWTRDLGVGCGGGRSIARVGHDRLALGTREGNVVLLALATGEPLWRKPLAIGADRIAAIGASPDGRWIVVGGPPSHNVHVLAARDGSPVARQPLPAALDSPTSFLFSEGELLVGTLRGTIVRMKLD